MKYSEKTKTRILIMILLVISLIGLFLLKNYFGFAVLQKQGNDSVLRNEPISQNCESELDYRDKNACYFGFGINVAIQYTYNLSFVQDECESVGSYLFSCDRGVGYGLAIYWKDNLSYAFESCVAFKGIRKKSCTAGIGMYVEDSNISVTHETLSKLSADKIAALYEGIGYGAFRTSKSAQACDLINDTYFKDNCINGWLNHMVFENLENLTDTKEICYLRNISKKCFAAIGFYSNMLNYYNKSRVYESCNQNDFLKDCFFGIGYGDGYIAADVSNILKNITFSPFVLPAYLHGFTYSSEKNASVISSIHSACKILKDDYATGCSYSVMNSLDLTGRNYYDNIPKCNNLTTLKNTCYDAVLAIEFPMLGLLPEKYNRSLHELINHSIFIDEFNSTHSEMIWNNMLKSFRQFFSFSDKTTFDTISNFDRVCLDASDDYKEFCQYGFNRLLDSLVVFCNSSETFGIGACKFVGSYSILLSNISSASHTCSILNNESINRCFFGIGYQLGLQYSDILAASDQCHTVNNTHIVDCLQGLASTRETFTIGFDNNKFPLFVRYQTDTIYFCFYVIIACLLYVLLLFVAVRHISVIVRYFTKGLYLILFVVIRHISLFIRHIYVVVRYFTKGLYLIYLFIRRTGNLGATLLFRWLIPFAKKTRQEYTLLLRMFSIKHFLLFFSSQKAQLKLFLGKRGMKTKLLLLFIVNVGVVFLLFNSLKMDEKEGITFVAATMGQVCDNTYADNTRCSINEICCNVGGTACSDAGTVSYVCWNSTDAGSYPVDSAQVVCDGTVYCANSGTGATACKTPGLYTDPTYTWMTNVPTSGTRCCGDDGASDDSYYASGSLTTATSVSCERCLDGSYRGTLTLYGNSYTIGVNCFYGDITCSAASWANGSNITMNCTGIGTSCCYSQSVYLDNITCTDVTGSGQSPRDRDNISQYCSTNAASCTSYYWLSTAAVGTQCCGDDGGSTDSFSGNSDGICCCAGTNTSASSDAYCATNSKWCIDGYYCDGLAYDPSVSSGTTLAGDDIVCNLDLTCIDNANICDTNDADSTGNGICVSAQTNFTCDSGEVCNATFSPTNFSVKSQSDFDLGTYNHTFYNTTINAVTLNDNDTEQELPNNRGNDGWINMNGNVLLMHLNNDSSYGENDTRAYDFSGMGNNGTIYGPVWNSTDKILGAGALVFDGVNDYLNVSHSSSLNLNSSFTYSLWARLKGNGTTGKNYWSMIVKNPGASGYGDPCHIWVESYAQFNITARVGNGTAEYQLYSKVSMNDYAWHQIGCVFDDAANMYYLYVDGVLRNYSGVASTWVPTTNTGELIMGNWPAYANFFNGTLDEVAIWNRTLSAAEIKAIYDRQQGKYISPGIYTSKIFDANTSVRWVNMSWREGAPYGEELPNYMQNEQATTPGGINMTGNVLLFHLNNDSSYGVNHSIAYDFSGNGNNGTTNKTIIDDFDSGESWSENQITGSASGGNYVAQITGVSDPFFLKDITDFDESYDKLTFRYKSYANGPKTIRMFYTDTTDCSGYSESCAESYGIISDGEWHTLDTVITDAEWVDNDGVIGTIRFDFDGATSTGTVYVDYIDFRNGPNWTTSGKFGSALSFDGVNDYVDFSPDLGLGSSFSVAFWINYQGTARFNSIGKNDNLGNNEFLIFYERSGGENNFDIHIENVVALDNTSAVLLQNQWHHIAVTHNSTALKIYQDGILKNQNLSASPPVWDTTGKAWSIGQEWDSDFRGDYFNGSMDEVAIWNRSLSASEVYNLYLRGLDLKFYARACNTSTCANSNWSQLVSSTPANLSLNHSRYFQYMASFNNSIAASDANISLYNTTVYYEGPGLFADCVLCGDGYPCDTDVASPSANQYIQDGVCSPAADTCCAADYENGGGCGCNDAADYDLSPVACDSSPLPYPSLEGLCVLDSTTCDTSEVCQDTSTRNGCTTCGSTANRQCMTDAANNGGGWSASGICTGSAASEVCTSDGAEICVDSADGNRRQNDCQNCVMGDQCDRSLASATYAADSICVDGLDDGVVDQCDTGGEICEDSASSYRSDCSSCDLLDGCDSDGGTSYTFNGQCISGNCCTDTVYDSVLTSGTTISNAVCGLDSTSASKANICETLDAGATGDGVSVVSSSSLWMLISVGNDHTCGILNNGSAYCWGSDGYGQLGNGAAGDQNNSYPVNITPNNFTIISSGNYVTCGIVYNGSYNRPAYCWGSDGYGQLGNGAVSGNQQSPYPVNKVPNNFSSIAVGYYHTCGILNNGSAYCWGNDDFGQLGNGAVSGDQQSPYIVNMTPNNFTAISTAGAGLNTCGILNNGSAYCWGSDSFGQLGNGAVSGNQYSPDIVNMTPNNFTIISTGGYASCGILNNGSAYCWGADNWGTLGNGAVSGTQYSPYIVNMAPNNFTVISAGAYHVCGILINESAYCWGSDDYGQQGNGYVSGDQQSPYIVNMTPNNFTVISAGGGYHTCGILVDGSPYCWGWDSNGQLGNGAAGDQTSPYILNISDSYTCDSDEVCYLTTTARYQSGCGWCGVGESCDSNVASPTPNNYTRDGKCNASYSCCNDDYEENGGCGCDDTTDIDTTPTRCDSNPANGSASELDGVCVSDSTNCDPNEICQDGSNTRNGCTTCGSAANRQCMNDTANDGTGWSAGGICTGASGIEACAANGAEICWNSSNSHYQNDCSNCVMGSACDISLSGATYVAESICVDGADDGVVDQCDAGGEVCEDSASSYRSGCSFCDTGDACDSDGGTSYSANGVCSSGTCVNTPVVISVNITPSYAYTNVSLDCGFNVSGVGTIYVNVTWFRNRTMWLTDNETILITSGVVSNTTATGDIEIEDTNYTENWTCSVFAQNGNGNSGWVNSTNLTISNAPPSNVSLDYPINNDPLFTDMTPSFNWTNATDIDGNASIRYNFQLCLVANCASTIWDVRGIQYTNYTYPTDLPFQQYYWRVAANDSFGAIGAWSDIWTFTLVSSVSVTLINDIVDFGNMSITETNDTTDNLPSPFVIQNIGNLYLNITINASSLWESEPLDTLYYQFKANNTLRNSSFNRAISNVTYRNMTNTTQRLFGYFNYSDGNNYAACDINITVPSHESVGTKTSAVVFYASI